MFVLDRAAVCSLRGRLILCFYVETKDSRGSESMRREKVLTVKARAFQKQTDECIHRVSLSTGIPFCQLKLDSVPFYEEAKLLTLKGLLVGEKKNV